MRIRRAILIREFASVPSGRKGGQETRLFDLIAAPNGCSALHKILFYSVTVEISQEIINLKSNNNRKDIITTKKFGLNVKLS